MSIETFAGYQITDLHAAFAAVQNSTHWKYPVDATVSAEALAITLVAVPFMVGGTCEVLANADGTFQVRSAGYYNNIGA